MNANTQAVLYQYDALNRATLIDYAGTTLDTQLSYDEGVNGKGRLTSVTDGLRQFAATVRSAWVINTGQCGYSGNGTH